MSLLPFLRRAAPALALTLAALPLQAGELATPPAKRLSADSGRVIVKFKDDSSWRKQILSVRGDGDRPTDPARLQQLLQDRATLLGQRRGLVLQAATAVDERTQAVMADGVDSARLAALLAADPEVEYAVPDGRRRAWRVPNDPLYVPSSSPPSGPVTGQWYLKPPTGASLVTGDEVLSAINAQGAWDITTGHRSVVVAVLDSGVRPEHPDLAGKLLPGYDMIADATLANDGNGRDADPSDPGDWVTSGDRSNNLFKDCDVANSSWHGTKVAGLIAAATNNGAGMAGAGWNVRLLPVRVLGKCFGYDSDIIAGMRWAAGLPVPGVPSNPNPAKVLNLSLGGEGACTQQYRDAVSAITATGAVVVAAAGNTTGRAVNNPANCPGVIGVAALRHIGTKVGFSDVGPEISIAAPGGNCVNLQGACLYPLLTTSNAGTTTPGASNYSDSYAYSVGTSFSAPLVAGTAALMMTANRTLTPAQVLAAMRATARPFPQSGAPADPDTGPIPVCQAPGGTDQLQCYCTTTTCGAGMLDAQAAVAQVARLEAYVDVVTTSPAVGSAVVLASDASVVAPGRSIVSRQWTLVSGGGALASLDGVPSDGPTLTVTPTGAGTFVVRLTLVDSNGSSSSVDQAVTVPGSGGTPTPPPPPAPEPGGGGGSMSVLWVLALGVAAAFSRPRRRA